MYEKLKTFNIVIIHVREIRTCIIVAPFVVSHISMNLSHPNTFRAYKMVEPKKIYYKWNRLQVTPFARLIVNDEHVHKANHGQPKVRVDL